MFIVIKESSLYPRGVKNRPHKFLLVTDNTTYIMGGPRYLGPYRIAHELEEQGIQTFVLDKFYSFPDFFDFLENFLDEDFIGVGISTTFFTPPEVHQKFNRYSPRNKRSLEYYRHGIIAPESSKRKLWFQTLKAIMAKKCPKAKIFVGGSKAQFMYQSMYDDLTEVDYVVMGVVDKVFPQIVNEIIQGNEPIYKMMGNKKVIDTANQYKQPKVCPPHDWKKHWFIQKNEVLPIEIGRGCAFNCKFCNYDKKENFRKSLDDLKSEFIKNYENHGTQYYHFVDDCFNDSRVKVEEVGNLILSLPFKIEWASYLRFDLALKFPETSDLIVASGGRAFHWGVESLTQEVARRAGKGASSDMIKEFIVNFSKKHRGICYSTGSFIAGLPGETEESWVSQINWLIETENFDFIQMGPLGIAPYKHEFDGSVIDYADYSRNPAKYGFSEVDISNNYWKHETCDQKRAQEWSDSAMKRWEEKIKNRKGMSTDIWIFPVLRSLGFTVEEVSELYFNPDVTRQEELRKKASPLYGHRNENYFKEIWSLAKEKPPEHST